MNKEQESSLFPRNLPFGENTLKTDVFNCLYHSVIFVAKNDVNVSPIKNFRVSTVNLGTVFF